MTVSVMGQKVHLAISWEFVFIRVIVLGDDSVICLCGYREEDRATWNGKVVAVAADLLDYGIFQSCMGKSGGDGVTCLEDGLCHGL